MLRLARCLSLAVAAVTLGAVAAPANTGASAGWSAKEGFVVHEWGTFTHFAGSNGAVIDGLGAEEEELPTFVHTFGKMRGETTRQVKRTKGGYNVQQVFQKMETPVIYFYTPDRKTVTVDVEYRSGVLSEWFPQLSSYEGVGDVTRVPGSTRPSTRSGDPIKLGDIRQSKVRWIADVLATGIARPGLVAEVDPNDPWAFARDVAASWLFVGKGAKKEAERYIFYRGLSAETRAPQLKALPGGKVQLTQGSNHRRFSKPLLLAVRGDRAGAVELRRELKPGDTAEVVLKANRSKAEVVAELKAAMLRNLVASGLYEDEARAMVKTWTRSWFDKDGRRLIYLVNEEYVNWMLPLKISPAPRKLVRTFVGRLDFLTPEKEASLSTAVHHARSRDRAARAASKAELASVGRFLEPALRRILSTSTDTRTQKNARALLAPLVTPPQP